LARSCALKRLPNHCGITSFRFRKTSANGCLLAPTARRVRRSFGNTLSRKEAPTCFTGPSDTKVPRAAEIRIHLLILDPLEDQLLRQQRKLLLHGRGRGPTVR